MNNEAFAVVLKEQVNLTNNGLAGKNKLDGVLKVALSYILWGVLPIYWKALKSVPSDQIIAHRIIWSVLFIAVILIATGGLGSLRATLTCRRDMIIIAIGAVLIAVNWYTYIWAVNSNHIVEASMGYYMNPLVSVLLGMFVLKEKMDVYKYIALFLAAAGIAVITIEYGKLPWVALILALSFGLYGLFKKLVNANATTGLALETVILLPVAAGYIVWTEHIGTGALGRLSLPSLLLLSCAGVVTAIPFLLFGAGAKKVEMSTLGFLQYLSPTINLILGIFLYKENFSTVEMVCFGLIWISLIIFSISRFDIFKKLPPAKAKLADQ